MTTTSTTATATLATVDAAGEVVMAARDALRTAESSVETMARLGSDHDRIVAEVNYVGAARTYARSLNAFADARTAYRATLTR